MKPGTTRRLASQALATCLMMALAVFPTSCASTEATPMRTPTLENPWPDSTRARVQACVEQGASDLPEGQSTVHIDLFVTPEGHVQEVRAKGATLAARDVQICINQALEAMTVPAFVLEQARSVSNEQPVTMQSRELMGDVTVGEPPRNFTGGHTDPKKCAQGWIDADCGGNRTSGAKGARPGRRH